jgi:3-dehydroquinate synthase
MSTEIKLSLGYSVWVGSNLLEDLHDYLPLPEGCERIALVSDRKSHALHGGRARAALTGTTRALTEYTIDGNEDAKSLGEVEALARALAGAGLHRRDLVVALGGGVVTDLAGFVAASYLRGIAWAAVPTTVLGQIDAAVGGKTGVNLPEGKNLVGAFHQPAAVIADVTTLSTLPRAELISGLAEVAKHGFIADPSILDDLAGNPNAIREAEPATMEALVAKAATVKARIVEEDPTEQGRRAFLNYGHTLGHALEACGWSGHGPARRHGEAVSIGMIFAAALAHRLGLPDLVEQHRGILDALGLPTGGAGTDVDAVLAAMRTDKKYLGGLRFVLLDGIGSPRLVDVDEAAARAAYEEVA